MEFKGNQAIYLQIAEYVSEQILLSRWHLDDRIPSVRELGVDLQVNPNTVMRAYDFLQTLDIIYNKRGVGYFVSVNAFKNIKTYRKKQFMEQDLPVFFKTMTLLEMDLEDIKTAYEKFKTAEEK
jgi:DNA-binding transcriptional regulator YhcF (GntR family)